jgi:branched-subunit amino acid transport protein
MKTIAGLTRSFVGGLLGYVVIALLTTLFFEAVMGGIGFTKSSGPELLLAGFFAVVAGLAGGVFARWIGGSPWLVCAGFALLFLTIDTVYVLTSGISSDPLWFDLAASLTLMAATVAGVVVRERVGRSKLPAAA